MTITILPSDKGDCLLLTANDGTTILADGGMGTSYKAHVRPFLGQMLTGGTKTLDLVYVSHIDQDHIAGVLQMMDDLAAWRVYEHRKNDGWKKPTFPQPPTPKEIWHNSFHEQLQDNAGAVESLLAAAAAVFANSRSTRLRALAAEYRDIAVSIPEAIKLSRRVSAEQLGIPLNKAFGKKLGMVRSSAKTITRGGFKIRLIGPFSEDVDDLREKWNKWLKSAEGKKALEKIRRKAEEDEDLLGTSAGRLALDEDGLGNRKEVTPENLASLMLLVDEGARRVVMTGDGHSDEVLKGLKKYKVIRADGTAHVDVLKVQHHGSEHNLDRPFAKTITADHYIVCGNGHSGNPDPRVIRVLLESRRGTAAQKSQSSEVDRPCKFWFSSGPNAPDVGDRGRMTEIEQLVKSFADKPNSKMTYAFGAGPPLVLNLP